MQDSPDLDPQIEPPHGGEPRHENRRMHIPELPDALRSALIGYEVSLERLNAAVVTFVADAKRRGMSVEQVVPEVRRYLSAMPRWTQPIECALPADMTVIDRAVQWAIEAYFHQDEARGDSSSVA